MSQTTIIDNGTGLIKAGLATDELPTVVFPTIVGHSKNTNQVVDLGDEARFRGDLSLEYPIHTGIIKDWSDMEDIWNYTFNELGVHSSTQTVMLTQAAMTPVGHKEQIAQIMFEGFGVKGLDIMMQSVLGLYYNGKTTGVVVDCGAGVNQIVPIYEGFTLEHASLRVNIGGTDLTNYLQRIMSERGYHFSTTDELVQVEQIKEKCCYSAFDYKKELTISSLSSELEMDYELPDGRVITLGSERFKCAEVLFQPSFIGLESDGIHEVTYHSIMNCDCDLRKDLYHNIVVIGGSSCFPGLKNRLKKEIVNLAPPSMNIDVQAQRNRKYATWLGGALFANLSTFSEKCMTKKEYDEFGSHYILTKH